MSGEGLVPLEDSEGSTRKIGPYELLARFTDASLLERYLARRHSPIGVLPDVVLKLAPKDGMDAEMCRNAVVRELRDLSCTHHVNLVSVLDAGDSPEGAYIVVEHVRGTDLRRVQERLRTRGEALPFELACYLVSEILRGLHHAHSATTPEGLPLRVVHREVQPGNVRVSTSGHVKLGGFGGTDVRDFLNDPAKSHLVRGTLPYLPAEYLQGEPPDPTMDVYGAGVLLFELLSGHRCIGGQSNFEVMSKILDRELRLDRLKREGVPAALQDIVSRATIGEERFRSAGEMASALESWVIKSSLQVSAWILSAFFKQHSLFEDQVPSQDFVETQRIPSPTAKPPLPEVLPIPPAPAAEGFVPPTVPDAPQPVAAASPTSSSLPTTTDLKGPKAQPLPPVPSAPPAVPPAPPPVTRLPDLPPMPAFEPTSSSLDLPATQPEVSAFAAPVTEAAPVAPMEYRSEPPPQRSDPPPRPKRPASRPPAARGAWSGSLNETSPVQVLAKLASDRVSGTVEFKFGLVWKRLDLRDGRALALSSNMGMEQIGEQLVRRKLISRLDLDRATRESFGSESAMFERLLSNKLLEAATLEEELGRNLGERLEEVIGWTEGTFEFRTGLPEGPPVMPKFDFPEFLGKHGAQARASRPSPAPAAVPKGSLVDVLNFAKSVHDASQGQGRVDQVTGDLKPRK